MIDHDQDPGDGGHSTGAVVALGLIVVLVVGGLWLADRLHAGANMQECLASGRNNCAPIETPTR